CSWVRCCWRWVTRSSCSGSTVACPRWAPRRPRAPPTPTTIPRSRGMRRIGTALILASVVLLEGCITLGPDYQEPDVGWLKTWQSDLYGQIDNADRQTNVDLNFWWEAF